jgi:hypothetical protein
VVTPARMLAQGLGSFLQPREHLRQGNSQSPGDFHEIGEAEVGFAPLDRSHEGSVDATKICERLLGVASAPPKLSNSLPQSVKSFLHLSRVWEYPRVCVYSVSIDTVYIEYIQMMIVVLLSADVVILENCPCRSA